MRKKYLLFLIIILVITLTIIPGCKGDSEPELGIPPEPSSPGDGETTPVSPPEPSSTYTDISNQIAGIDPSSPSSLASLLSTALDIENAKEYGQYEFLDACKDMGIVKKDL